MSDIPSTSQVPEVVVFVEPPSEAQVVSARAKGLRTALFIDANLYSSDLDLESFDYVGLYHPNHRTALLRMFVREFR